jgi:hypothetical protein
MALAITALGAAKHMNHSNSIKADDGGTITNTPFKLTLYACEDLNCVTCSYDSVNIVIGS